MNYKKLFKLSLFTLPISILIFLFINTIMGYIAGGLGSTRGFPIPYHHDIWETPDIEFNQPVIIVIDILIIYTIITFVVYQLKRNKNKQ